MPAARVPSAAIRSDTSSCASACFWSVMSRAMRTAPRISPPCAMGAMRVQVQCVAPLSLGLGSSQSTVLHAGDHVLLKRLRQRRLLWRSDEGEPVAPDHLIAGTLPRVAAFRLLARTMPWMSRCEISSGALLTRVSSNARCSLSGPLAPSPVERLLGMGYEYDVGWRQSLPGAPERLLGSAKWPAVGP